VNQEPADIRNLHLSNASLYLLLYTNSIGDFDDNCTQIFLLCREIHTDDRASREQKPW
jgi:hypothetical protein